MISWACPQGRDEERGGYACEGGLEGVWPWPKDCLYFSVPSCRVHSSLPSGSVDCRAVFVPSAARCDRRWRKSHVGHAARDLPWIYPSASVLLGYICPAQFTNCFRLPMLRVLRVLRLHEVFRGLETHFNCISFNGNISGSSLAPPHPFPFPLGCLSVWATVWRSDGGIVWYSDALPRQ